MSAPPRSDARGHTGGAPVWMEAQPSLGASPNAGMGGADLRRVAFAALGVLWVLAGLFLVFALVLRRSRPEGFFMAFSPGVAVELFLRQDVVWLGAIVLLVPLAWALAWQRRDRETRERTLPRHIVKWTVGVFLTSAAVGVPLVMHRYALSLDEFMARFQAAMILRGQLFAEVPEQWRGWEPVLQPIFMQVLPRYGVWTPAYLPGNAAILALFGSIRLLPWAHVLLGAAAVAVLAPLTRRVFPGTEWAPPLACLLLATSPQMWITAMTSYAMTPHLLASILWVYLFLRNDRLGHASAALLGAFAIGIHQAYVHPLIAAPFLLDLLRAGRRRLALAYAVWYGLWLAIWTRWQDLVALGFDPAPASSPEAAPAIPGLVTMTQALLRQHSLFDLVIWPVNLARFMAWQNLVLLPLCVVGLVTLRRAPQPVRAGVLSVALLLLVHVLLMPGQGHGWGFRYLHPALGFFSLLAVHGANQLRLHLPDRPARQFWTACVVLGWVSLAALPLRASQVERFVRPYALSSELIAESGAEVVVIDDHRLWFGVDLVRNTPDLSNRPVVISGRMLAPVHVRYLCNRYRTRVVDREDLARFGLEVIPLRPTQPPLRVVAARVGCPFEQPGDEP